MILSRSFCSLGRVIFFGVWLFETSVGFEWDKPSSKKDWSVIGEDVDCFFQRDKRIELQLAIGEPRADGFHDHDPTLLQIPYSGQDPHLSVRSDGLIFQFKFKSKRAEQFGHTHLAINEEGQVMLNLNETQDLALPISFSFSVVCVDPKQLHTLDELKVKLTLVNEALCEELEEAQAQRLLFYQHQHLDIPENLETPLHVGLLIPGQSLWESCPNRKLKCSLEVSSADNDVFRLNGPNIEITKEFDRENGPTYFENRIICTVENLEGLTLLRVHQNISVRVKDVDDNPPQPQDKIAIQVKSRNLTKGDVIEFPTIFYDLDLPQSSLYSLEFPGTDFLKNGTALKTMPYECHGLQIMAICQQTNGRFNGTVLYMEPKLLEVVRDVRIPPSGLDIKLRCQDYHGSFSNSSQATFDMHIHYQDPSAIRSINQNQHIRHSKTDTSFSTTAPVLWDGKQAEDQAITREIRDDASAFTRVANLLTLEETAEFRHVFIEVQLTSNVSDSEEDKTNMEFPDTPFMLTRDRQILYINEPARLRPGDQYYMTFRFEPEDKNQSLAKRLTVEIKVKQSPAQKDCLGGFSSEILCSEYNLEEECVASCGEGSTHPNAHCQWIQENRDNGSSYSTCSNDPVTCPDLRCDYLEAMSGLCPQDCVDPAHLFGMPQRSGSSSEEYGLGVLSENMRDLICTCAGDSCSCIGSNSTYSLWDERRRMDDEESFLLGHGKALRDQVDDDFFCNESCLLWLSAVGCVIIMVVSVAAIFLLKQRKVSHKITRLPKPTSPSPGTPFLRSGMDYGMSVGASSSANTATTSITANGTMFMTRDPFDFDGPTIPPVDVKWEFPRQDLVLEETIGEGEFGKVMRARAFFRNGDEVESRLVAVKMLKSNYSQEELHDLISEYALLKEVNHPNVIRLLGACTTRGGPLSIIMEYAEHGSLRNFLRASRGLVEDSNKLRPSASTSYSPSASGGYIERPSLSFGDILSFAWQIAKGMNYLTQMKLVHRDLAARNVLVGEGRVCKVSDFGLTRDVYVDETYWKKSNGRIPVKWLAPESLKDHLYTTKSDVWSFGVLLWELVTLGSSPYPGVPPERILILLNEGFRMEQPQSCSNELYEIMTRCWGDNPDDRPSFEELIEWFESLLQNNTNYLDLSPQLVSNPAYLEPIRKDSLSSLPSLHFESDSSIQEKLPLLSLSELFEGDSIPFQEPPKVPCLPRRVIPNPKPSVTLLDFKNLDSFNQEPIETLTPDENPPSSSDSSKQLQHYSQVLAGEVEDDRHSGQNGIDIPFVDFEDNAPEILPAQVTGMSQGIITTLDVLDEDSPNGYRRFNRQFSTEVSPQTQSNLPSSGYMRFDPTGLNAKNLNPGSYCRQSEVSAL